MTIEIKQVAGIELYHRYPLQSREQPCFVELDARGEGKLRAAYSGEIGNAVPMAVFDGHVLRWRIPALRAEAANDLLDQIAPLADRVVAGYESQWDGNNEVGRYTADATNAIADIERLCERAGGDGAEVMVAQASDHFAGLGSRTAQARELGITAETTDEQLDEIEQREIAAVSDEIDIIEGLSAHLRELRSHMADEAA